MNTLLLSALLISAPMDKQLHAGAGAVSGFLSYSLGREYGLTSFERVGLSVALATASGTAKELRDIRTTGFDVMDIGYTVLGGAVTSLILWRF